MKSFETKFKAATVSWTVTSEMQLVGGDEVWTDFVLFDLVYCAPDGRGRGYAKKALVLAIAEARAAYPELEIRLVVEPQEAAVDADGLVRLYEDAGFRIVNTDVVVVMAC